MAEFFEVSQRLILKAALAALVLFTLTGAVYATELLDIRFGPAKDTTRIVFDLNGAPGFNVSGDDLGKGRIFVDFESLDGALSAKSGLGHVARVSFTRSGKSGARATLEFKNTAKITEVFVIDPSPGVSKHRLVIDLATSDQTAFLASLPSQYGDLTAVIEQLTAEAESEPSQNAAAPPQMANVTIPPAPTRKDDQAALVSKKTIVIDAGHGGRDPGSQGQSGTLEKTVTLSAALELAAVLKKSGRYDVVLTRESDDDPRMVRDQREELARREALAREAGADLFISLHADAISEHAVRGASVYTLSDEGNARSVKVAKSQGNYHAYNLDLKQYEQSDPVLGDILMEKARDKTLTSSSKFADLLIENLAGKTPLLNRSHRKGDLRVLLATDVPAVLLEMAFISNAKDEANLISPVWRKRTMDAVADSIDAYFESETLQRHARLLQAAGN